MLFSGYNTREEKQVMVQDSRVTAQSHTRVQTLISLPIPLSVALERKC
jgi:hypothetical protein